LAVTHVGDRNARGKKTSFLRKRKGNRSPEKIRRWKGKRPFRVGEEQDRERKSEKKFANEDGERNKLRSSGGWLERRAQKETSQTVKATVEKERKGGIEAAGQGEGGAGKVGH